MITVEMHLNMLDYIRSGKTIEEFIKGLKPMDALEFIRSSEHTYPIETNITPPKHLNNVTTSVHDMVLGQFIMVEQIITGKTRLPDHRIDLEILKLIDRPKHHTEFDNENSKDEEDNEKRILQMDVREAYWVLTKFMENRNRTLFKEFSGVFYEQTDEEDEEEEKVQHKTAEMLFSHQWYWYSIVRMLAHEDIRRYGEIYMLPMQLVLPEMSYLAQRDKIERARERERQALSRL